MARTMSAPLAAVATAGPCATATGATGAAAGADGADSSRRNRTVGRGISGADGLAAATWTRDVSFFAAGMGAPITAVSFFASCSGLSFCVGGPGGMEPPGRPVTPAGRLIRTVSFLDSS